MAKKADVYLLCDPWMIIEEGWHKDRNMVSESVFSLSNEYMGVRGYAEEGTIAPTLRGSYFNGIYEEIDLEKSYKGIVTKTHFMVNAVDWLYTQINAGEETLDMASCTIRNFRRTLDMRDDILKRSFDWHTRAGTVIHIEFTRFLGMENPREGFQKMTFNVKPSDVFNGTDSPPMVPQQLPPQTITVVIANSFNTFHGWNKKNYWDMEKREWFERGAAVQAKTIRTGRQVFSGFSWRASDGAQNRRYEGEKSAGFAITLPLTKGGEAWIEKSIYNCAVKERNAAADPVWEQGRAVLNGGLSSFDSALARQQKYWADFWKHSDIRIEGDSLNQQGIRFCIFQMHQTYHGYDPSNNIGAKGLTGEAYNGHAFWDSEVYFLPYYLFSNRQAARNLLEYRYATLDAARERALMLDCRGACFPGGHLER